MKYISVPMIVFCMALAMTGTSSAQEAPPAPVTTSEASGEGAYGPNVPSDVIIQIDPETGSLIVIADEETNAHVAEIIKNLDVPVPQVLINVVFLEVTHNKDVDLGLEGGYYRHDDEDEPHFVETAVDLATQTETGFYRVLTEDMQVTLRALSRIGELEVLSRPSILAKNNREAVITVGQEVPFIRNSRVTEDGQIINTVEYEDIGIILRVTPYISPDGLVEMDLNPEISTLTGDSVPISSGVTAPVFAKRSAETRVVVPNGKTVVIGGLMETNNTSTVYKVPILGSIPVLGFLFRRTVQRDAKTELLIFMTPKIVDRTSQLAEMSDSEKEKTDLLPKLFGEEEFMKYLRDEE